MHTSRGLRTTTTSCPACGMSRTRCSTQACTREDTTPHAGQPSSTSTGSTLTRRPPKRRSTASTTRYPGRLKITLAASRREPVGSNKLWSFLDGCIDTPISAQGHEPLHHRLTTLNCEVPQSPIVLLICEASRSAPGPTNRIRFEQFDLSRDANVQLHS